MDKKRGFAGMDPAKQKELASRGGKAAHAKGVGHEWTSAQAAEAGRRGGMVSRGGRGKLPAINLTDTSDAGLRKLSTLLDQ